MRAHISKGYLLRVGAIALLCVGGAAWFFYDGVITYPAQRERALTYQELKEQGGLDDQWPTVAKEHGWSTKNPGEPKSKAEIQAQLILGGLIAPFGVLYVAIFARHWGRWVEADDRGLRTSKGQEVPYSDVVTLEKKKWEAKGIARVHYERDGRRRRVVLDDWKFETEPTRAILRKVESAIGAERISGGPPEPTPEEQQAEGAQPEEEAAPDNE